MSEVRLEPFTLLSPPAEANSAGSAETIDPTINTRLIDKAGVLFLEVKARLASIAEGGRRKLVAGAVVGAAALTGCGTEASAGETPRQGGETEITDTANWSSWTEADPAQPDCEASATWQETPEGDVTLTPILKSREAKKTDHFSTIAVVGTMSNDGTPGFARSFIHPGANASVTVPADTLQQVKDADAGVLSLFVVNTPQELQEEVTEGDALLKVYADALGYDLDLEDGTLDQANVADYNDTRAQSRAYSSTCVQVQFTEGEANFIVGTPGGVQEAADTQTQDPPQPEPGNEQQPNMPTQEELQAEYPFIDNLPSNNEYSTSYSVTEDGELQINVTIPIPADLDPSSHKDYFQYERDLALAALSEAGVDLNTIDVTFTPA